MERGQKGDTWELSAGREAGTASGSAQSLRKGTAGTVLGDGSPGEQIAMGRVQL